LGDFHGCGICEEGNVKVAGWYGLAVGAVIGLAAGLLWGAAL